MLNILLDISLKLDEYNQPGWWFEHVLTILKSMSPWEGLPIYEMENKIHVPNHQPAIQHLFFHFVLLCSLPKLLDEFQMGNLTWQSEAMLRIEAEHKKWDVSDWVFVIIQTGYLDIHIVIGMYHWII
jgi:hypothetical protein